MHYRAIWELHGRGDRNARELFHHRRVQYINNIQEISGTHSTVRQMFLSV